MQGIAATSGCSHDGAAETDSQEGEQAKVFAAELAEQEVNLNAAAAARCRRFNIHLVCGDFHKAISSRRKYANKFDAAFVGVHHAHVLTADRQLKDVMKPRSYLVVEKADNLVALKPDQVTVVNDKLVGLACTAGFEKVDEADTPPTAGPFCCLRVAETSQ
jgi:Domain of unknown function (DUF4471)